MIQVVMGKPGVGKSTYLAYMAKKAMKKGIKVYCNYYIKGAIVLNINDLYVYDISNALVIIEEAGQEFNSRDFKNFKINFYKFFTMHRHYQCDVIVACQHWERLDKSIRELIHRITVIQPTILKFCIKVKDIKVKIGISEEKQIVEEFSWKPLHFEYHLKRPLWKMFDSFVRDFLPNKSHWELWYDENMDNKPISLRKKILIAIQLKIKK